MKENRVVVGNLREGKGGLARVDCNRLQSMSSTCIVCTALLFPIVSSGVVAVDIPAVAAHTRNRVCSEGSTRTCLLHI